MKKLGAFFIVLLLVVSAKSQSLYSVKLKDIDGQPLQLNHYMHKKILFYLLPLSANDSAYQQLVDFKQRYGDTLYIFGIPSKEDGYQASMASNLKTLYSGLGIVLTEGMYTKKASPGQSDLCGWLTEKTKNGRSDADSKGIASKFFTSKIGKLYAVFPPQLPLQSPVVEKIVQAVAQ